MEIAFENQATCLVGRQLNLPIQFDKCWCYKVHLYIKMSESLVPLISSQPKDLSRSSSSDLEIQPLKEDNRVNISTKKKLILGVLLVLAYIVWGSLISLQPPFYPTEAEKKGATPSQVCQHFHVPSQVSTSIILIFILVWICIRNCPIGSILCRSTLWNVW